MTQPLPRFVYVKRLASGKTAFYWHVTKHYRMRGCTIPDEPLGTSYAAACGEDGAGGRAAGLNRLFDEWRRALAGEPVEGVAKFGTVDWLFREYKLSVAYQERVSERTRGDYERIMLLLADWRTKKGDRIGDRPIKAMSPVTADKLYALIAEGGPARRKADRSLSAGVERGASTASRPV